MKIYVPWGLIAIFICLRFFYATIKRNKSIKENRQDRLTELQEQLLTCLRNKKESPEDNKELI